MSARRDKYRNTHRLSPLTFVLEQISYFESRMHHLFLLYYTLLVSDVSESEICASGIPFKAMQSRALTRWWRDSNESAEVYDDTIVTVSSC